MDAQALATTPLFLSSLAFCALVAAYAIAMGFRSFFRRVSQAAASAGLRPYELEAVEHAGIFHGQFEDFMEKVVTLEGLSSELPQPFHEGSWSRVLDLCDNLEAVRSELHLLLSTKDFATSYKLGRLLSGESSSVPAIPRPPGTVELRLVSLWHKEAHELLQRMISRIEDTISYKTSEPSTPLSKEFTQTLQDLKTSLKEES
jgi:hypothetical protein